MMRWFQIFGALLFVPLVSSGLRADVNFISRPLPAVQEMAAREGKLYFVHFSAKWSMVCSWMEKNTYVDPALSDYVNQHYIAVKLDIDDPYGQKCQVEYDVHQIPAILVFNTLGELIGRKDYSEGPETLTAWFRQHREKNPGSAQPENPSAAAPGYPSAGKFNATNNSPGTLNRPALKPEAVPPTPLPAPPPVTSVGTWSSTSMPVADASASMLTIQTGVFGDYSNALQEVRRQEAILRQTVDVGTMQQATGRMLYRITVGQFRQREEAELFLQHLQQKSIQGFIRPLGNQ